MTYDSDLFDTLCLMSQKGKIIWVYGSSAAGKETFIKSVTRSDADELLQYFGWSNQPVIMCKESIDWVAQYENDPLGDKRAELLDVISHLAKQNPTAIVLVKGQDLDLKAGRLKSLKDTVLSHDHEIIFLEVGIEEIFRRLKNKQWWEESFTREMVKGWLTQQLVYLKALQKEFKITVLDARAESEYKIISHVLPEDN